MMFIHFVKAILRLTKIQVPVQNISAPEGAEVEMRDYYWFSVTGGESYHN